MRIPRPLGALYKRYRKAAKKVVSTAKNIVTFRGRWAKKTEQPSEPLTPPSPQTHQPTVSLTERSSSVSSSGSWYSAPEPKEPIPVGMSITSIEVDTDLQKKLAASVSDKPALPQDSSRILEKAKFIAKELAETDLPGHQLLPCITDHYERQSSTEKTIISDQGSQEATSVENGELNPLKKTLRRISQWGAKPYERKEAKTKKINDKEIEPIKNKEATTLRKALMKINEWSDIPYTPKSLDSLAFEMANILNSSVYPSSEKLTHIRKQLTDLSELLGYLPPIEQSALKRQHNSLTQLYEGLAVSQIQLNADLVEDYMPQGNHFETACRARDIFPNKHFSSDRLENYRKALNYHRQDSTITTPAELEEALKEELAALFNKLSPLTQMTSTLPTNTSKRSIVDQLAALSQASPFFPEGKIFNRLCEEMGIKHVYNHVSIEAIEDYRNSLGQLINEGSEKDSQWLENSLLALSLKFFQSVKSKEAKVFNQETLLGLIKTTVGNIRQASPLLKTDHVSPAFGDDSPALRRTGQQLQCYLHTGSETSKPTAAFRCEKVELHQNVINTVIEQWCQQKEDLDAQIKQKLAQCGTLDFTNDVRISDAIYSSLKVEIARLKKIKQEMPFPDFPLMLLTSANSTPMDKDFFYTTGITSAIAHVQLHEPNRTHITKAFTAITSTATFRANLADWSTQRLFLNQVMNKCCRYFSGDIINHDLLLRSEKLKLDKCFVQTNSAINDLLLNPGQDGASEGLHFLRLQAALLKTYSDQLVHYKPPPVIKAGFEQ